MVGLFARTYSINNAPEKDKSENVIYSNSLVKSSCLHYWEYAPVHKRVALHYVIGNMHQHTGGLHYWEYTSAQRRVALHCISGNMQSAEGVIEKLTRRRPKAFTRDVLV